MATKPRLSVSQNKAPDCRYVVDVFNEADELICYCGPYSSRADAMTIVDQFVTKGWSTGNAYHMLAS